MTEVSSETISFVIVKIPIVWTTVNRYGIYAIIWALIPGTLTTYSLERDGWYKYANFKWWLVEAMNDLKEAIILVGQLPCFVEYHNTTTKTISSIWQRSQVRQFTFSL